MQSATVADAVVLYKQSASGTWVGITLDEPIGARAPRAQRARAYRTR